jgi:hypothetical protein
MTGHKWEKSKYKHPLVCRICGKCGAYGPDNAGPDYEALLPFGVAELLGLSFTDKHTKRFTCDQVTLLTVASL